MVNGLRSVSEMLHHRISADHTLHTELKKDEGKKIDKTLISSKYLKLMMIKVLIKRGCKKLPFRLHTSGGEGRDIYKKRPNVGWIK